MATFKFKDGKPEEVPVSGEHDQTTLLVSAALEGSDEATKFAGHSIVNCDGEISIQDVQFDDHPLDSAVHLHGKKLVVLVDVTKFIVKKKEIKGGKATVSCTITIKAGDDLIGEYELNDTSNPQTTSKFIYLFTFKKDNQ